MSCIILDSYKADVLGKMADMKKMRVGGVPFFIIENQNGGRPTAFSGAQVEVVG
jgi:predicted DsbA family dithiol-disulfide isomerase